MRRICSPLFLRVPRRRAGTLRDEPPPSAPITLSPTVKGSPFRPVTGPETHGRPAGHYQRLTRRSCPLCEGFPLRPESGRWTSFDR